MTRNRKSMFNRLVPISLAFGTIAQVCSARDIWANYPACAVNNCLEPIANSFPCETNDDNCVCTTAGFVNQVATCLGQNCASEVVGTFKIYISTCKLNGYDIAVSSRDFLAEAGQLTNYLETTYWQGYPSCANNPCLTPLTEASGCLINDDSCVCQNSTLVTQFAQCVGKSCSANDVLGTYSTYSNTCQTNGYSIALSNMDWVSGANINTSTITTEPETITTFATSFSPIPTPAMITFSVTANSTITETSFTNNSTLASSTNHGGLSTNDIIALAVGIPAALAGIVSAVITWVMWRNKARRTKELMSFSSYQSSVHSAHSVHSVHSDE